MKYKLPPTGWIHSGKEQAENVSTGLYYYRKNLNLESVPSEAFMKISADSRYRLYVNGKSVSFGPCKGDGQIWYYEQVDIAPYLVEGENILAAVVMRISPLSKGARSIWRTNFPGFFMQGTMKLGDSDKNFSADESWKWHKNDRIIFVDETSTNNYLSVFERAAGNSALAGWMDTDYDDSDWENSQTYSMFQISKANSPGNLNPRPIPSMYEHERRFTGVRCVRESDIQGNVWDSFMAGNRTVVLSANSTHVVEIDAGELTTGFLELAFSGGSTADVEILTSESYVYEPNKELAMPVPKKGDRTDNINGILHGYLDTYHVDGFGNVQNPEKYEPFWFRTFRYIQLKITVGDVPLTLNELKYRETGYPLDVKTLVETSDRELGDIWNISLRSLKRCMHETYEDCPFYEQLQYAMDARTEILYTYCVCADDRMARRTMDDFHRSLRADGLLYSSWPSINTNVIPTFSLFFIMMVYDHMMYFGDKELIERYFPTIEAILNFFHRNLDDRGLVGNIGGILGVSKYWSFVDWAEQWNNTAGVPDSFKDGPITVQSLMYAYALDIAAKLAVYVHRREYGDMLTERSTSLKQAVNSHCVGKNGLYQDGPGTSKYSQHGQVWAVLSDTAPAENQKIIMEMALKDETMPKCSVAMAFYLFRALEKVGLYHETRHLWEPWRSMLKDNLTTCEEDQVSKRSDCHAWGAVALYEIPSVILGIKPTEPGYKSVSIKPNPTHLHSAKGNVITPHGIITVEWEAVDGEVKLNCSIPEGIRRIE